MGLLTNKLHQHLRDSFANVRKDTATLYDWINYLNARVQQQEQTITQQHNTINALHNHLRSVPTSQQVKELVARQSPFHHLQQIQQRLNNLHQKVSVVATLHDAQHTALQELKLRVEQLKDQKGTALEKKLVKSVTRNSKSYMKNILMSTITKYQKISALQLKELIVDEQKLCSKSSFYRLLQELENEEKCELMNDGRQKIYTAKTLQI